MEAHRRSGSAGRRAIVLIALFTLIPSSGSSRCRSRPDHDRRRRLLPQQDHHGRLQQRPQAVDLRRRAAQLDRHRAHLHGLGDVHRLFAAYAIAAPDFPQNILLLASLWPSPCSRRSRSSARCRPCRAIGLLWHVDRLIHPVHDVHPAVVRSSSLYNVLQRYPRSRTGRADRQHDAVQLVKVVTRSLRRSHHGHPRLHDLLDDVRVRVDADVDQLRRTCRGDAALPRALAVRRSTIGTIAAAAVTSRSPCHRCRARLPAPDRRA